MIHNIEFRHVRSIGNDGLPHCSLQYRIAQPICTNIGTFHDYFEWGSWKTIPTINLEDIEERNSGEEQ